MPRIVKSTASSTTPSSPPNVAHTADLLKQELEITTLKEENLKLNIQIHELQDKAIVDAERIKSLKDALVTASETNEDKDTITQLQNKVERQSSTIKKLQDQIAVSTEDYEATIVKLQNDAISKDMQIKKLQDKVSNSSASDDMNLKLKANIQKLNKQLASSTEEYEATISQLQDKIASLTASASSIANDKATIKKLQNQIASSTEEYEATIANNESTIKKLQNQIAELVEANAAVKKLESEKKAAANNERKLNREIDMLKLKVQELQGSTSIKKSLEKATKDLETLTKQKDELLAIVDDSTNHNKKLKEQMKETDERLKKLQVDNDMLQNDLTSISEQRDSMDDKIKELEDSIAALEKSKSSLKEENQMLQKDLMNITEQKFALDKKLKNAEVPIEIKQELEKLKSERKDLDYELDTRNTENENLKGIIDKLKDENVLTCTKIMSMETVVAERDAKIASLNTSIIGLQKELEELKIMNEEKDAEIDRLMTQINLRKHEIEKCKSDIEQMQIEINQYKDELDKKNIENEHMHQLIATKEASIARLRRMCEELQSEMSKMKRRVDALTTKCKIFEEQIEEKVAGNIANQSFEINSVLDGIESNISEDTISLCCSNINTDDTMVQVKADNISLHNIVQQTLLSYDYLSNTTIKSISISFTSCNKEGKTLYWYGKINDGFNDSNLIDLSVNFGFHEEGGEIINAPNIIEIEILEKMTLKEVMKELKRMNIIIGIEKRKFDSGIYIRDGKKLIAVDDTAMFISGKGKIEVTEE